MKANTLLLGILMLIAGGVVLVSSWGYSTLPNQSFGSDTMPRFVGLLGFGIGLALVVQSIGLGQRIPTATVQDWGRDPRRLGGLAGVILAVLSYIFFAKVLGFLPIAFLLMLGLMLLGRTRPLTAVIVAVIAAFAIQMAFGRLLMVPLPRTEFLNFLP